ncbi:MAG: zinc ribbon domain-containing protein [Methanosphaera sp.]|uniref:zinc ribbon domain-containing protein n=1 Tax=Methanosphaera sp. TaxID=2666342 RepID=UPI0026190311|nr:zinc ribbon domain-containing protein [Methanosphaera sp.]MDD6534955.1 zinc ribbon domain-containing protein [Methanosphaera sp.]
MTNEIYCSNCAHKNSANSIFCESCGEILRNTNLLNINQQINTIDELFNEEKQRSLNDFILTLEIYEIIIQNIIENGQNNIIYKRNMTTFQRVKEIAKAYTIVTTKEDEKSYGEYLFNIIKVDNNFDSAQQIATLLHELTHFLFNEIIKQILMYIWNIKSSSMLDAYIQTITSIPQILLISEYCASSTEREFLDEKYVSFSSFNSICHDINYDENIIKKALIIGKPMSESIINILNNFIDKQLKIQIKKEFIKNNTKANMKPICINDEVIPNFPIFRNVNLMNLICESYEITNEEEIHEKIVNYEKIVKNIEKQRIENLKKQEEYNIEL